VPDTLIREPFLGGYAGSFGETTLAEVTDLALVSIAVPLGGRDALDAALDAAWGASIVAPGRTAGSSDGATRLIGLAPDLLLAVLPHPDGLAAPAITDRLGATAYVTEQSDNWVILRLAGPAARPALERICPIDLHPAAFPEGRAARTMMEHLGAIVVHEAPDTFLLLSASSSAGSFLHALETSLRNVT
jgi:methylglutamate dehydrogenase subunit D